MNSINQQQPEDNHENLSGTPAIKKIQELAKTAQTCFFGTSEGYGDSNGSRPMSVLQVDNEGCLWFLVANDSHTYKELDANPKVKLYFQGSAHSEFMQLNGRAVFSTEKNKIHELWNPIFKTWFTEGENDPRIAVIEVIPYQGYYWDTKHGPVVAGVKMLFGAVTGRTTDDSIEGKLSI